MLIPILSKPFMNEWASISILSSFHPILTSLLTNLYISLYESNIQLGLLNIFMTLNCSLCCKKTLPLTSKSEDHTTEPWHSQRKVYHFSALQNANQYLHIAKFINRKNSSAFSFQTVVKCAMIRLIKGRSDQRENIKIFHPLNPLPPTWPSTLLLYPPPRLLPSKTSSLLTLSYNSSLKTSLLLTHLVFTSLI